METRPEIQKKEQGKNQHPIQRALAVTAAAAGIVLVATGCGKDAYRNATNTYAESCGEPAPTLPTDTNTAQIEDTRGGNVYACNYLDDLDIPYNKPTELYGIDNNGRTGSSSFDSNSRFKARGDILGFSAEGNSNAAGSSRDWRVTTLRFKDSEGLIQTIEVPSEKLRFGYCADDCKPTMTVEIPKTPLFAKPDSSEAYSKDTSSIWSAVKEDKVLSDYASYDDQDNKYRIDASRTQVMQSLTDEKGTPADPGQVVAALSSSIVLRIPAPTK